MYEDYAENKLKNNLFEYATSELSQDVFICWLASYAHENAEKDAALNECARKMLAMFVPEFEGKDYKLLNVERQVDNVDVLLTVECEGKFYKIIVEDKTYTSEHDNQLNRYKENLIKQQKDPNVEIKGVYYKTGFQCDMSNVIKSGYEIIDREKMLQLLGAYADKTNNQIFISYYEYWKDKQKLAESYKTLPVVDWGWWAVYNFYDYLHRKSEFLSNRGFNSDYWYVANPSGGFECLYIPLKDTDKEIFNVDNIDEDDKKTEYKCWLYLQIETILRYEKTSLQIRLKMGNEDGKRVGTYSLKEKFLEKYVYGFTNFVKPARLSPGQYMTVGIYDVTFGENDGLDILLKALDEAIQDYYKILEAYNKDQENNK